MSLIMSTFIGLMIVFPGCTKRPAKASVLGKDVAAEQQAIYSVGKVKQMVSEKKAGAAKPYLALNKVNLPLD